MDTESKPVEQTAEEVDWKGLATYLAKSIQTTENELSKYLGRHEEDHQIRNTLHHLYGTDLGCHEDFGVRYTKDGWTTKPIPGWE